MPVPWALIEICFGGNVACVLAPELCELEGFTTLLYAYLAPKARVSCRLLVRRAYKAQWM